jgi:hypothetical protein
MAISPAWSPCASGSEQSLLKGQQRTADLSPNWLKVSARATLHARRRKRNPTRIGKTIASASDDVV